MIFLVILFVTLAVIALIVGLYTVFVAFDEGEPVPFILGLGMLCYSGLFLFCAIDAETSDVESKEENKKIEAQYPRYDFTGINRDEGTVELIYKKKKCVGDLFFSKSRNQWVVDNVECLTPAGD